MDKKALIHYIFVIDTGLVSECVLLILSVAALL